MGDVLVTVSCITYNHEKYIADAIEGFLMQKTDFPIEIIIHDDASTDRTPEIIRSYQKKHPDLIKPIFQTVNKYSQGVKISPTFVWPRARGKYIASCEGDDYWTDPYKLQKQVDYMEANPETALCFHAVSIVDVNKKHLKRYLGPNGKGDHVCDMGKCIASGAYAHVCSRLFRAKCLKQGMPKWFLGARHGDYAMALYLAANGKVYFMDRIMSAHRLGVEGSLMTRFRKSPKKEQAEYYRQRISTLWNADRYYNYQFHHHISRVNKVYELKLMLMEHGLKGMIFSDRYRRVVKQVGLTDSIKLVLSTRFPKLARALVRVKRNMI